MALPQVFAFTLYYVELSTIRIHLALFRKLSFNSLSRGLLVSLFEGLRLGSVVDLQSRRYWFAILRSSVLLLEANCHI